MFSVNEGGVCSKLHSVKDAETGQKSWRSHNTGVVNFAYNQRELPEILAKLAFVHELGHSLGSPVRNSDLLLRVLRLMRNVH